MTPMMNLIEEIQYDLKNIMKEEIKLKKLPNNLEYLNQIETNLKIEIIQEKKLALRTVISKLPLLNKKKSQVKDDELIPLIKSIIKDEKTRLLYTLKLITPDMVENINPKNLNILVKDKLEEFDSLLSKENIKLDKNVFFNTRICTLNKYLPRETTEEEIIEYIKEYIDFSKLKTPMQAIGIVKNQFGNSVDGGKIKKIIDIMKG